MNKNENGFERLDVWQRSVDLVVLIYELTKNFPSEEKYALISQMKRCSTSVSANIAEGYGRQATNDKLHFYTMAYGSLLELKSFLYIAQKLGYCEDIKSAIDEITILQKQINALRSSIKS